MYFCTINQLIVMQTKSIFLLSVFLSASLLGTAQRASEYVLTELPTQQQLPVANVHCIYQDREGFVWYGTRGGGLCRDNGYHIDVFRSDRFHPNLIGQSNDITGIAEDYQGHIIFSSKEGLYILDKQDYSIRMTDEQLAGHEVGPILVASDSTIWVCSQRKVFHYNPQMQLMAVYPSLWKGKKVWASRMMEDSQHRIWVTQWDGGIVCFNSHTGSFEEKYWPEGIIPADLVEDPVLCCFWIGTWGKGIMKYNPDAGYVEQQPCTYLEENSSLIIHLNRDKTSQRLWASTMYGLHAYDIKDHALSPVDLSGILPKGMSVIDNTAFDSFGNLWVSGFSPHTFILSKPDTSIIKNSLSDISEQLNYRPFIRNSVREGNYLWLGQDRKPIVLYDTTTGQVLFDKNNSILSRPNIEYFYKCVHQPGIWVFEGPKLYHIWHDSRGIQSEVAATARGEIHCVYDGGEGLVYIGHREGIDVLNTATGKINALPISSKRVKYILKAQNGHLYYCADNDHLMGLGQDKKEVVISDIGDFTAIAESKDGRIWAADREGDFICHDPSTGKTMIDTRGSHANGDGIKKMAIDQKGHIWLLSDQLLKEYNPKSGAYRVFRSSDKDIQMDCFHNVKSEGDHVCIDGAGGIVYITPSASIDQVSSGAHPIVTSIAIDGEKHIVGMNTRNIDIEHDAVNIEIQISTLNHLHADKASYAYRLSCIDDQWHYLPQGVNKATFVRLPKGEYTVELMATDEYGCWGESTIALTLDRLPAWYETWWARLLFVFIIAGVIALLAYYYLSRQKEKQQYKMNVQLTELKLRFFTNISHELRTPLTLILTPLESLLKKLDAWEQEGNDNARMSVVSSQLVTMEKNANRLLNLVNKLLDFRKLEMGQQKLELTNGDICDFIRTVCETFRSLSTEKGIDLVYDIPKDNFYMNFDSNKLQHIMCNLLSNAFKFTSLGGQITVGMVESSSDIIGITVKDTGCGIPSRDLPYVFDRYYQSTKPASPNVTGTGIGLHLTKEYVQMHGGSISVSSKEGEGSTFTVLLPTNLQLNGSVAPQEEVTTPQNSSEVDVQKANILIVDDNHEFRQFLASELADLYQVHQAADGKEALRVVQEQDIDLVVSDVMMPIMDGLELCKTIKQDINTSHVMVILLTARSAEEAKLEGFRSGADEYLSKPFNMEMLQLRINHLLELRKMRSQDFLKGEEMKVEEVTMNEIDQKFLHQAIEAVEKNLNNEEYDVDALASDVYMSRSTLYRKIHSLTGQKPSIFIRTIRLKHAARLIKEGKHTITEISDMCGFSSLSYFSRSFKAQYGIQPGNYTEVC